MRVEEGDSFGAPSLEICAGSCTWVYELEAGGFSSLRDRDGREWIGFAPGEPSIPGGPAHVFRGIANLVFPDNIGHPGYRHCSSEWTSTPGSVSIRTTSKNGLWRWSWTIDEEGASLVVEAAPKDRSYWFLYEGTPGGRFDLQSAYWGTGDRGRRDACPRLDRAATGVWNLAWFGDDRSPRVLAVRHKSATGEPALVGWMAADAEDSDGMVVFGFGRTHKNGVHPNLFGRHRFRVQLVETTTDEAIVARMHDVDNRPG